ncbi:MAG: recombination mediator RecR [bacterium]|nr:recombination mediator RecR [bacterium]
MTIAKPIRSMIEAFERLPGIGPKTAQRLTYYLLHAPPEESEALAEASQSLKKDTVLCGICFNVAEADPCEICASADRRMDVIAVVEDPLDMLALEKARFDGRYHVLHGAISPLQNIGPDELKIRPLLSRVHTGDVKEIILATNPTMEGEATAMYIAKLLKPFVGLKITRLARGLPVGGDIEYADEVTLTRALEGRREY